MPFLIIILIIVVGVVIYSFYTSAQKNKQREANIERRKSFVASFLPNARIIVNNGDYLFFVDDTQQVFGINDSRTTYSYAGLSCIALHKDSIHIGHTNASWKGLDMGKDPLNEASIPLDSVSVSAIANAMMPILRKNLHEKLTSLGVTPTHEYVNRGEIWGCDINNHIFYNTHAYIQIHNFSKLLKVTTQDVSNNSNWQCNYIITVTIKGSDGWDDNEFEVYVDDQATLNNLLAMFKGIKNRQNSYNAPIVQKSFDTMEGHEFEYFCANLLRKNGYENVDVTQGSGDQGIDIIAYREGIKYGIQCKCYSSDIGNKAIQEVFAGKTFYECHVGVVLTNRYFTKSAIELAQKNGIILWDRDKLISMIDNS